MQVVGLTGGKNENKSLTHHKLLIVNELRENLWWKYTRGIRLSC